LDNPRNYRLIDAKGVAVAVISGRKVLLFKRRSLPMLKNPGVWSFVFGGKERGEQYVHTAYREVGEESGIKRDKLHMLGSSFDVLLFDKKKRIRWRNRMFIFRSDTSKVRKDFENAAYRWATIGEIRNHVIYENVFMDEAAILKKLSRYIDE
jgi:8-oxo-dGTP pyrophosphatase MutT (NUDIX family)